MSKFKNFLKSETALVKFWISGFAYCCFIAIAVQKLFLPMMPDLHGGHGLLKDDSIVFHEKAVEIAARIHAHGWSEWSLFPPGHVGNVSLLAALYALFGAEPAVFIPLNAAAHATGALMFCILGPVIWPGKIGRVGGLISGTLYIAFPSALAWYSQNHKDSFVISGALMVLYAYLQIQQMGRTRVNLAGMFSLGLAGVALLTIFRPYFTIIVGIALLGSWLACLCVTIVQSNCRKEMFPISAALLFVGMIVLVGFGVSKLEAATPLKNVNILAPASKSLSASENLSDWKWEDSPVLPKPVDSFFQHISSLRVHFIRYGKTVKAGSAVDEDRAPSTTFSVLAYMPRALFIGLFAPFPDSWAQRVSIPRVIAAIETSIWYCSFFGLIFLVYRKPIQQLLAGVVFCCLIIMLLDFVNPNIGTLYRLRYGFWMFFLLCGAIGWVSQGHEFLAHVEERHQASASRPTEVDSAIFLEKSQSLGLFRLVSSGGLTMIITLVGYLGFFMRDLMLIQSAGLNSKTDSVFLAMMIPMVIVSILAIPISDAITGPFVKFWVKGNFEGGRYFIRKVLFLAGLLMGGSAVVLFIFAAPAVRLILEFADTRQIAEGAILLRLYTPVLLLATWTVVGNAVLNALNRFRDSSLAQLSVPICSITAILVSPPKSLMVYAILGMVVGTLANAVIVVILCHCRGINLCPSPARSSELVPLPIASYGWLISAALFTALSIPVNYMFAGMIGIGGVSGWALGSKMILLFNGLLVAGVTTVLLPHMAKSINQHTNNQIGRYFLFLLLSGTWIGGIILLGASLFVEPVVASLLRGPYVTEEQVQIVSQVFRIGLLQLPVMVVGAIMIKAAVVNQRSFATVLTSALALAVNIAMGSFLVRSMGILGIAYASLAAGVAGTLCLVFSTSKMCGIRPGIPWILMITWGVWVYDSLAITSGQRINIYCAFGLLLILAVIHVNVWRKGSILGLSVEGR